MAEKFVKEVHFFISLTLKEEQWGYICGNKHKNEEEKMGKAAYIYLAVISIVAFAAYGIDKYKARHGKWRIPESTLILLAVAGGSIGALAGMRVFRHKTKHWKFIIGIPLILILQIALIAYCVFNTGEQ